MKRIITAIGNQYLNQVLRKEEEFDVVTEDIQYKEGIIEFLEKDKNINFIILSELLQGDLPLKQLVETIKNNGIELILILENKNEELENFLLAKGTKYIFYHNQVEIKKIINIIKNKEQNSNEELKREIDELKQMLLERNDMRKPSKIKEKRLQKEEKMQSEENKNLAITKKKKEVICVSGTSGVGKSIFTVNLAKTLSAQNNKILVLDFDILNNSLHTILGVNRYSQKIKERLKKNDLLKNIQLEELIIKINSKIHLVSGINLLFDSKYKISSCKVKNILDYLKENYDIIIIDTSSECFFDYTKEIMKLCNVNIFITEANLLEIKKAKNLLNMYINAWKIPQSNFNILFNKYNENSIDISVLKNVFSGFSILGKLSISSKYNLVLNQNGNKNLDKKLQKEYAQIHNNLISKIMFSNNS